MELLLASASPRRRELLDSLGVNYGTAPGGSLDEVALLASYTGSLQDRLQQLALKKGAWSAEANPAALVLSADTEVILDGRSLGKPLDAASATEMLQQLSGRSHAVCTAISVQRRSDGIKLCAIETTLVRFATLSTATIESYVTRVQPFDYAGGYAIQGLGSLLIERIEGDYSNVVGLPLRLTAQLLGQAGLRIL